MKFWIGNLAKTAKMAVVFAQLHLPSGKNAGPHAFLVQIRDEKTHETFSGVDIGDCGDKIGIQGVDNGWMTFNQFWIPKSALLN